MIMNSRSKWSRRRIQRVTGCVDVYMPSADMKACVWRNFSYQASQGHREFRTYQDLVCCLKVMDCRCKTIVEVGPGCGKRARLALATPPFGGGAWAALMAKKNGL
jgi:hypothetical protein